MPLLQNLYRKIPFILLLLHLALGFGFCMYVTWKTDTLGGDTLEHIHSSWLVYANFIPYKDFFQHHNPLLWYTFAPLVGLHAHGVDDNIITASVVTAAVVVSFINYYYLYLITSRFLTNKLGGLIAASIALTPYIVISILQFRPDNFMMAAFFAGLFYYFSYLKERKLWQLCLAMLLFLASFMFLQKIIFTLILLAVITLYLLLKKQIPWVDVGYAILLPSALSLFYVAYLWKHDILLTWYNCNFTANLYIPKIFAERRIGMFWPELKLLLSGSALALIFLLKNSNIYFKIISIIFVFEFCQRVFYFSAFAYYFYLLIYLAAILTAVFLSEIIFKNFFYLTYILCISLFICMYKPAVYEGNIGNKIGRFYNPLNKQVVRASTPCDYILNGDGSIYNLYNRDPHYYWNLLGQIDIIGAKAGVHPLMDINEVIRTKMPKIIFTEPYKDKYYSERGETFYIHVPDKNLINTYYQPFENSKDVYILKPEYRHIKCDYDYKQRYYHAYD